MSGHPGATRLARENRSRGGHALNIRRRTVDHHGAHLMLKLDIHDGVDLARFAIGEGILPA